MEIGNMIQKLRKENRYSQEQLAEKMGVARQTISKWELGETSPDIKDAKKLSKIFNVSLDQLTDNDVNNILVEKISNTEHLAGIIIKILKVFGIVFLSFIILIVIIICLRKYFEVKPNLMVADSYGIYCTLNKKQKYYEVTTQRDNPGVFELNDDTIVITNEMGININNYTNKESLINDINDYVISKGGSCK